MVTIKRRINIEINQATIKNNADNLIKALKQYNNEQIQYYIDLLLADGTKTALSELIRAYYAYAINYKGNPCIEDPITKAILDPCFVDEANISLFIDFASVVVWGDRFKAYSRLKEFNNCLADGGLRGLIPVYISGIFGRMREGEDLFASSLTVSKLIDSDGNLIRYMPTKSIDDARIVRKGFYQRTFMLQDTETFSSEDTLFFETLKSEHRIDLDLRMTRQSHGLWAIPECIESLSKEEYIEFVEIPSILTACWLLHEKFSVINKATNDDNFQKDSSIQRLINRFSTFELFSEHAEIHYGDTSYRLICLLEKFQLTKFIQGRENDPFSQEWKQCIQVLETYNTNEPSPFLPVK